MKKKGTVTFRLYANFNDGRGMVRATSTEYRLRKTAEAAGRRLGFNTPIVVVNRG